MLNKADLIKLENKYQDKANKAYRTYQETGITRYDTERRNAENLADALHVAINAKEDHDEMTSLRYELSKLAKMANELPYVAESQRDDKQKHIIAEIIAIAKLKKL